MTKLRELVETVKSTKYKVANDKINQLQRNELKANSLDALMVDLQGVEDLEVLGRTKKGILVGLPNDVEGVIYAEIDIVLKNLDYDPSEFLEEYQIALAKRLETETKRKASK